MHIQFPNIFSIWSNFTICDNTGQDYFDIFGAAHKLTDGAIDGANIMSDGVINAGLGVAGGALNGARHNSDLFIKMWGEQNHSRHCFTSFVSKQMARALVRFTFIIDQACQLSKCR